jgi:bleomycin hydrolase
VNPIPRAAAACLLAALALPALHGSAPAQSGQRGTRDHVRYEKRHIDPVLDAMEHDADSLKALADSATSAIQKATRDRDKKKDREKPVIRFDWSGVARPSSVEAFKAPFHFPPRRQYRTGTCWSFSTTSYFESEVRRLTGQEIRLSPLYTVYWEYVEKALGYVAKRGGQPIAPGSESDAVSIIWRKYGTVPEAAYSGLAPGRDKYDDNELCAELRGYLEFARANNYWDEAVVVGQVRAILDKYMGRPPEDFEYAGRRYTPKQFLDGVVKLNLDDYVEFMSTLSVPFYTRAKYDFPDNWRPTATAHNVPLQDFYAILARVTARGWTAAIGGDTSESGMFGLENAAVVPSFDIPQESIDQDSRELRIDNLTTGDDHGLHVLASMKTGGHDWYLIKDSGAGAQWGRFKGYFFYRDDYVKLKMLTLMVHKDAAREVLAKFPADSR